MSPDGAAASSVGSSAISSVGSAAISSVGSATSPASAVGSAVVSVVPPPQATNSMAIRATNKNVNHFLDMFFSLLV